MRSLPPIFLVILLPSLAPGQEPVTLGDTSGQLMATQFSSDGRRLAVMESRVVPPNPGAVAGAVPGSPNSPPAAMPPVRDEIRYAIRVWETSTGRTLFARDEGPTCGMSLSLDGTRLAALFPDGVARVWEVDGGRELLVLRSSTVAQSYGHVAFSPGGTRLATWIDRSQGDGVTRPSELTVWDARTGQRLRSIAEEPRNPLALSFSPDGGKVLAESSVGIRVWDIDSRAEGPVLRFPRSQVPLDEQCRVFSRDGAFLIKRDDQTGVLKGWSTTTGREVLSLPNAMPHWPSAVAIHPDGRRIAVLDPDGLTKLRDLRTGQESPSLDALAEMSVLRFNQDGRRLITVERTGQGRPAVQVWDVATGANRLTLRGEEFLALSPDGSRVATVRLVLTAPIRKSAIHVWDLTADQGEILDRAKAEFFRSLAPAAAGRTSGRTPPGRAPLAARKAAVEEHSFSIMGYTGSVMGLDFAPDGRRIATISHDVRESVSGIEVFDAKTGRKQLTLAGTFPKHNSPDLAFSPDGRFIAAAGNNVHLKLWDATSGAEVRTFERPELLFDVTSLAFRPGGKELATGHVSRSVAIWDVATGRKVRAYEKHTQGVLGVAYRADGKRLASAGDDGTIIVWEADTGAEVATCRGHTSGVTGVAFSPDGRRLVSGSKDLAVIVWDAATGRRLRTLEGHRDRINGIAIGPDGRTVASASEDNTIKLWDIDTGAEIRSLQGPTSQTTGLAFSPDGRALASTSALHRATLWEVATGKPLFGLNDGHVSRASAHISPDGSRLVTGGALLGEAKPSAEWRVWDVKSGTWTTRFTSDQIGDLGCFTVSPDGHRLAVAAPDHLVRIWDIAGGRVLFELKGHHTGVGNLAFSPDGKRLVSVGYSGSGDVGAVNVWDADAGRLLASLRDPAWVISQVAFSRGGDRMALVGRTYGTRARPSESLAGVFDTATGRELAKLTDPGVPIELRSHESSTGREVARLTALGLPIQFPFGWQWQEVTFDPEGVRIAGAFYSDIQGVRMTIVWEAATGRKVVTIMDTFASSGGLALGPGGRWLAAFKAVRPPNAALTLWDVDTGKEVLGLGALADVAAFSPDGRGLTAVTRDGEVKTWRLAD